MPPCEVRHLSCNERWGARVGEVGRALGGRPARCRVGWCVRATRGGTGQPVRSGAGSEVALALVGPPGT